jgi:hypothetical protein
MNLALTAEDQGKAEWLLMDQRQLVRGAASLP